LPALLKMSVICSSERPGYQIEASVTCFAGADIAAAHWRINN
jgi:hypothetical protein